ncbi:hypothetical protein K440DRAFT_74665 [Wilcoxina mikolae CBS 423.85]|nr:hypothetical protein K440DRAFT_74665 [Wilcoxina mikolae CBS 423.85]
MARRQSPRQSCGRRSGWTTHATWRPAGQVSFDVQHFQNALLSCYPKPRASIFPEWHSICVQDPFINSLLPCNPAPTPQSPLSSIHSSLYRFLFLLFSCSAVILRFFDSLLFTVSYKWHIHARGRSDSSGTKS